jgi:hypothetical protein
MCWTFIIQYAPNGWVWVKPNDHHNVRRDDLLVRIICTYLMTLHQRGPITFILPAGSIVYNVNQFD